MKHAQKFLSPAFLPVYFFIATILLGGVLLHLPISLNGTQLGWVDAMFTSVSATCVTGLIVVDTGTMFSKFGLTVIALLIQIGGLGVMTYTSLVFYLWRRRVSLTDRIAVGQSLQGDPSFNLGRFLVRLFLVCFGIEAVGAIIFYSLGLGRLAKAACALRIIQGWSGQALLRQALLLRIFARRRGRARNACRIG